MIGDTTLNKVLHYFADPPICKSVQKVHYGVAKQEEARIECEVDADPHEVVFHWAFNSSNNEKIGPVAFASDGKKSIAKYIPKDDSDYGRIYCWAQNSAGRQRDPCVFFVIEAGMQSEHFSIALEY